MIPLSIFGRIRSPAWTIRAQQIGNWIGAKVQPDSGYENDVCIYVRRTPCISKFKKMYCDIVDAHSLVKWLPRHENFGAIAICPSAFDYMKSKLKNEIVMIPQQHCNHGNIQRIRTEVKTVGFIGDWATFAPYEIEIREKLHKIGLQLDFNYFTRKNSLVVKFYQGIDVQVVWRKPFTDEFIHYKNALKLYNAGSFGIPTVAYPEPGFMREYSGCFLPANTIDQLIGFCEDLKNESGLYNVFSTLARQRAENYHISKIAELYKTLLN